MMETVRRRAPVGVVQGEVHEGQRFRYLEEVLGHAGVFFDYVAADHLLPEAWEHQVLILPGAMPLSDSAQHALTSFVRQGGGLLGLGGTSGLDAIFGVRGGDEFTEGYLLVREEEHPLTADLRSSLHVFGGQVVHAAEGTTLAELDSGGVVGDAVVVNSYGAGTAVLLAPEVLGSIVHIQQGIPVAADGSPAPDGSAPLDDGILKCEDGLVLDWVRDRQPIDERHRVFLEPISDELRELVLKGLFFLCQQQRIPLPVLWYWPGDLTAVAHLSHDSDGNDPDLAWELLRVTKELEVRSTWCILYPGGYSPQFYRTLQEEGYEIALHFDGHTGGLHTHWREEDFGLQYDWLREMARLEHILTNKNHYTRWEGRLEFYRWCENLGVQCDQTKGPSKRGTIGYALGGSHPWFPLDDEGETPRFLDVLEIAPLTQDLVVTCPPEFGPPLVDSAARHYGVAHFLFHPAHIRKPAVADSLRMVVDYARERGLVWWTAERLNRWERQRRNVQVEEWESTDTHLRCRFHAGQELTNAALLLLRPPGREVRVTVDGRPAREETVERYGFRFAKVNLDLRAGTVVEAEVAF